MPEQIIFLALIQGLTEFLPISSSGHLALMPQLAQLEDQGRAMDVAVHVGTMVAVIIYLRRELLQMTICLFSRGAVYRDMLPVTSGAIIATLPVVVAGWMVSRSEMDVMLRSVEIIAWATLLFGILLGLADRAKGHRRLGTITTFDSVVIGLMQVLALIPGTSRSGITMTAGRMLGMSRTAAARFSLILSIPVIAAAGSLTGYEMLQQDTEASIKLAVMAAGIATAVALASIHLMMALIRRIGFMIFVIYRVILGLTLLSVVYLAPALISS